MTIAAGVTHDIVLAFGNTTVGLLVDWERGPFVEQPDTRTAPKIVLGDTTHENYQRESYWSQSDFSGGLGRYRARAGDNRFYDGVADTREPDYLTLPPAATFLALAAPGGINGRFVRFNNQWWLIDGQLAYAYIAGAWIDQTMTAGANMSSAVVFNNNLYVARDLTNTILYKTPAGAWAALAVNGYQLTVFEGALWWSVSNNQLQYAANPLGAPSTFPYNVGDGSVGIVRMGVWNGRLYVGKPDGLYEIDGSLATSARLVVPFSRGWTNNALFLTPWQGQLYFPLGGKLWRYDGTTAEQVGFNFGAAPYTRMLPIAAAGDERYLYVLYHGTNDAGTAAVALFAYDGSRGGAGHHLLWTATGTGAAARTLGLVDLVGTAPTLWAWLHNGTAGGTLRLDDPQQPRTYALSGWVRTALSDLDRAEVDKWFSEVTVTADNLSATRTITVSVTIDGVSVPVGTFNTSPQQTISFPAGTEGRRMQVLETFASNSASVSPVQRDITIRWIPRPGLKRVFTCAVKVADRLEMLNGHLDNNDAATILSSLWAARSAISPVTLTDALGNSYSVQLWETPRAQFERLRSGEGLTDLEATVQLVMVEV